MAKHYNKAKKILGKFEIAGIDADPKKFDFMYSHIPVGHLRSRTPNIDNKIFSFDNKEDYSMYIHIPFCANRCKYCRFCAMFNPSNKLIKKYLDTMLDKELPLLKNKMNLKSKRLKVIYIGGGTPTFLDEKLLEKLLKRIRKETNPDAMIEIEAHPNTLTTTKLMILRKYKISRLSIGVQSFNNDLLQKAGRLSTKEQSIEIIKKAKKYFKNINVDLIFGLPDQTMEHIIDDIKVIRELDIASISWYQLWVSSRENPVPLAISRNMALSKLDMFAAKLLINKEMKNLGYKNKYNDWYLKSDKFVPLYEKFRINAGNNVGLGLSAYLFFKPFIFENTVSFKDYFNLVHKGELPISYFRKMNNSELELRSFAMGIKSGSVRVDFGLLPKNAYKRLNKLIENNILVKNKNRIDVNESYTGINKDYIAKFLIGNAWYIDKKD